MTGGEDIAIIDQELSAWQKTFDEAVESGDMSLMTRARSKIKKLESRKVELLVTGSNDLSVDKSLPGETETVQVEQSAVDDRAEIVPGPSLAMLLLQSLEQNLQAEEAHNSKSATKSGSEDKAEEVELLAKQSKETVNEQPAALIIKELLQFSNETRTEKNEVNGLLPESLEKIVELAAEANQKDDSAAIVEEPPVPAKSSTAVPSDYEAISTATTPSTANTSTIGAGSHARTGGKSLKDELNKFVKFFASTDKFLHEAASSNPVDDSILEKKTLKPGGDKLAWFDKAVVPEKTSVDGLGTEVSEGALNPTDGKKTLAGDNLRNGNTKSALRDETKNQNRSKPKIGPQDLPSQA